MTHVPTIQSLMLTDDGFVRGKSQGKKQEEGKKLELLAGGQDRFYSI